MKRLALAASIALAISTLGVGPATASTLTTAEALAAHEGTESPSEDAADPGEADEPGADASAPGAGTNEAEGDAEATEPPEDEAADPDAAEDGAEKDGAADDAEKAEAIDAGFSLEKTEMTAEEIGDPNQGVRYTVDSLEAGDVVTAEPGEATSTTVESDGAFTGTILGNTELKTGDTLDVTVTVKREGAESKTFSGSVEVVAPDDEEQEADLTVSPKTQNLDAFMNDGVQITLVNCVMDEEVIFRIARKGDPDTTIWEDSQMAGEDAAGSTTFIPGTGGEGWVGDFVVTASCGDESAETTFTVTDGDGDDANSDLTVSPKTQNLEEFLNDGVHMTFVNCHVDEEVTFKVSTKNDPDTTIWEEAQQAGEDAAGHARFMPQGEGGKVWVDEYLVRVSCGDKSAVTTFTVTGDDTDSEAKLAINPVKISAVDFINRDKGVTITVTKCEPGSEVKFEVWGLEPSEKLYEQSAEANENAAASVQIYGLGDDPAPYVGTYTVFAMCADQAEMEAEFLVTSNRGGTDGGNGGEAGESGPADDPGNAGSMPRTGAEITGLGAGAVLILGGAATVLFARRRSQLGQ
ncbi:hypothetical protein [Brevibacterium aurantiacum]|uniref:LPXTG cell wall anchor domain-containing protein n=1 Tax=Brevibacterium aurantiacum TaxID=273384 RepID=A0A556CI11_BREAU|nr:hypothetical protein [Brevibacterium aurantiacum]TSI17072.1 hypothetical protein FO013_09740 [Brevibacterium aurantiacum]